jgi:hypothetical protein
MAGVVGWVEFRMFLPRLFGLHANNFVPIGRPQFTVQNDIGEFVVYGPQL